MPYQQFEIERTFVSFKISLKDRVEDQIKMTNQKRDMYSFNNRTFTLKITSEKSTQQQVN